MQANDSNAGTGSSDPGRHERFSSRLALVLGGLGMAVGVGNIWRFPRMLAKFEEGGGTFLVPWVIFLFTWSIPLLVAETAIGRRTRRGVVGSLARLFGADRAWVGAFVALCTVAILCYYGVVAGWCGLYVVESLRGDVMAMEIDEATSHFVDRAQGGGAVVAMAAALLAAGAFVLRGVRRGIEVANKVLLPSLFVLLLVLMVVGLGREGAGEGVRWMFRVDPASLATPEPWLEALSQSAWSTSAGLGLFLVYSVAARHERGAVGDAVVTGIGNNVASLVAGLATIPAVFALAPAIAPDVAPVEVLGHRGPGGTGLSMVWLPRIFAELGGPGRAVAAAFFGMLFFAALTSLIALLELAVRTLIDLGVQRRRAVAVAVGVSFCGGLPSALSLELLTNQDWVWGLGLILSGLIFSLAARRAGAGELRKTWIGPEASGFVGGWLDLVLRFAIPVQFVLLIGWWFTQSAADAGGVLAALRPGERTGIGTCLVQWTAAFAVLFFLRRRLGRAASR